MGLGARLSSPFLPLRGTVGRWDPCCDCPAHLALPLLTPTHPTQCSYLQYKNMRPDYLKAIWQVVNWKNVSERLAAARK